MGKYSPSYYNSGVDSVAANAESTAALLTTRGSNNEYLEIQLAKKYDELGNETVGVVGGIKTNMKDPAQVEAAIQSLQNAISLAPFYSWTADPLAKITSGTVATIQNYWKNLNKSINDAVNGNSSVDPTTSTDFNAARAWTPPRVDPLILDLNGSGRVAAQRRGTHRRTPCGCNGIETVAPNFANPILFDHAGNGIKTGTGWVAATDGFLVLDRNGNGTIDNGTELFGDNTQLASGGTAANGFAALAGQDSNLDGAVNALDASFASLKVWQDLNQDGISQAGELKTLTELGIASLNVGKTAHSQTLAGGNQIADLGSFTRTDGTTAVMADVNLASDTFHRSFTDVIVTTTQTAALPDMQGAGMVRDLRQAASLTSLEGGVLANTLGQFAQAATRNDQRARLDALLADWAANDAVFEMRRAVC